MSCCCGSGYCTTRNYDAGGGALWQAPGLDGTGATRNDIAVDQDGNAYAVFGGIEKLDPTGARVYLTANDGRFHRNTLLCIAVTPDGTIGYVGSYHYAGSALTAGFTGANVFQVDLSDGSVIASASVGGFTCRITDICLDASGGVYFATTEGIAHFDGDFVRLADVGCSTDVAALALDDAGNLWAAGGECTTTLQGCPVSWSVRKYSSAGAFLDGTNFPSPTAIAWHGGFVYVGYRGIDEESYVPAPCNLVKFDDTTFECEWFVRIGASGSSIEDLAVNDDAVYAVDGRYLFARDRADGAALWCRKNEGSEGDPPEKKAGWLSAVAALASTGYGAPDGLVWATGDATPCNDAEEDACDDGACVEDACDCDCGESGRTGGTLVNCGCEEVACSFTSTIRSDCETLDGATIHWSRDATIKTRWSGTLTSDCGNATFEVNYDCDSETNGGWSITATGIISSVTITDTWCADGAPGETPFPGFAGAFTLDDGECDGCEGCLVFGTGECPEDTVDVCGCTGIPASPTATFSDVSCDASWTGVSATMAYDGGSGFTFSGTLNGKDFAFYVTCVAGVWHIGSGTGPECALSDTVAISVSCSPFQLVFNNVPINSIFGAGCGCASGFVDVVVTA